MENQQTRANKLFEKTKNPQKTNVIIRGPPLKKKNRRLILNLINYLLNLEVQIFFEKKSFIQK